VNVSVVHGDALQHDTPLLVYGAWEGEAVPAALANLIEEGDWTGKSKSTLLLYPRGAVAARRVLLVGLGKRSAFTPTTLREIAGSAAQRARELKVERYSFELPITDGVALADAAQALTEGSLLGLYTYQHYKTGLTADDQHQIAELTVISSVDESTISQGVQVGQVVARGVALARDMANGPGNDITPTKLGEVALGLAQTTSLKVTVLGLEELREQGFGGILSVSQGSQQPPRFIILEHNGSKEGKETLTVCLVGKGITFDTGGISLKPGERMDDMKMDMSGAAAVLGTMQAVAELNLPLHVVGLISAAENMPSGTAYKPGDVIKTLSGKTVEVLNTDAEGRIVLADALYYAQRYNPAGIIDLATLTGAIVVALGSEATGVMSNNDELCNRVLRAGEATNERAWRMPLWEAYYNIIKGDVGDIKNTGGRPGGALTAAAFLWQFVGDYPWVHMDIAGTAWVDRPNPITPKGATGVGVRLLVHALREWANE